MTTPTHWLQELRSRLSDWNPKNKEKGYSNGEIGFIAHPYEVQQMLLIAEAAKAVADWDEREMEAINRGCKSAWRREHLVRMSVLKEAMR